MKFTRGFAVGVTRSETRGSRPASTTPGKWPVFTAEVTPKLDIGRSTCAIEGLVETPTTWRWDDIHARPSTYDGDIHCVTTWSKLGMQWSGVSVDTLFDIARRSPFGHPRRGGHAHRIHDESAARRRHRRQGMGGVGGRR